MKGIISSKPFWPKGRLSRLGPVTFVAFFAFVGVTYLFATHAASNVLSLSFTAQDTAGNHLNDVYIAMNGTACSSPNYPSNHFTNPRAYFTCLNGYDWIATITLAGYHVCSCSAIQVGTQYGGNYPQNGNGGVITMESNTPPPSQPPSSSGGSSAGSGSSGSSGGSTSQGASSSGSSSSSSSPSSRKTVSSGSGSSSSSSTPSSTSLQGGSSSDIASSGDSSQQSPLSNSYSTPDVPYGKESTVKSSDNLVSVTFPDGTFTTDGYCLVEATNSKDVPVKSSNLIGPYDINCVDGNGSLLNNLKKPVSVSITLPSSGSKYAAYVQDNKWDVVKSSKSNASLNFSLAKAESFAAAPTKTINWGKLALDIMGLILLILLIGFIVFLLRRFIQSRNTDYNSYHQ